MAIASDWLAITLGLLYTEIDSNGQKPKKKARRSSLFFTPAPESELGSCSGLENSHGAEVNFCLCKDQRNWAGSQLHSVLMHSCKLFLCGKQSFSILVKKKKKAIKITKTKTEKRKNSRRNYAQLDYKTRQKQASKRIEKKKITLYSWVNCFPFTNSR